MVEITFLLSSLKHYGINFLVGEDFEGFLEPLPPPKLLAELTKQKDARMRLALIATLLHRPSFANSIDQVLTLLPHEHHLTFQAYYTAACYLQDVYYDQIAKSLGEIDILPDRFSNELGVPNNLSTLHKLKNLAQKHQEISGLSINWYGTYHHAAKRVISRLKKEREWAIV